MRVPSSYGWNGHGLELKKIVMRLLHLVLMLLLLLPRWQQWLAAQYVKMAYYLVNDSRQLTIDRLVSLIPIHHK